jgi:hypothetical protein
MVDILGGAQYYGTMDERTVDILCRVRYHGTVDERMAL